LTVFFRKEDKAIKADRPIERNAPQASSRAFLLVTLAITGAELLSMWLLKPYFMNLDIGTVALLDVLAVLCVSMPTIYLLFVHPMAKVIHDKTRVEAALVEAVQGLEAKVHARTIALEEANLSLQQEALERTKADAKIQFQARVLTVVQQAVVATGKGGLILYWNRHAEQLFGWTEEELKGQTLARVTAFSIDAARHGLSGLGAVKGWEGEVQALRRDGSTFQAHLTCSSIWRPDGSVAGFVYTFMDITERKRSEQAIRESEEKYSTVVESSPTGILIHQNGKIAFANPRFYQMVGLSPQNVPAALKVEEIIHPDDWPQVSEIWQRRLRGQVATQTYDCRIISGTGEIRWVTGKSALIHYQGQKALLVNVQDITERKMVEQALSASKAELHKLSARLITAQENERQRVAHELHDSIGQSLSAIKFMVERAIDLDTSKGRRKADHALQAVVPVIQSSVEEVRRISMALRPSTLDDLGLLATLTWFTREFQNTFPHIQIERHIEIEEFEIPELLKTSIFRIIQEAMNNAAKHSQATLITLVLRQILGDFQVMIADNGVGFELSAPRTLDSKGGFGLASMRERAELFGGSLIITSEVGGGTMILARWLPALELDANL
jgi:PAS domain S-box-containing protein